MTQHTIPCIYSLVVSKQDHLAIQAYTLKYIVVASTPVLSNAYNIAYS